MWAIVHGDIVGEGITYPKQIWPKSFDAGGTHPSLYIDSENNTR